jgi:hypothetical protein
MLTLASLALAAGVAGERVIYEAPEAAFMEALMSTVPDLFPFADSQEFLDALFASGYLDVPMVARQTPFATHPEYGALWKRQVSVSAHQLVHDAALDRVMRWDKGRLAACWMLSRTAVVNTPPRMLSQPC